MLESCGTLDFQVFHIAPVLRLASASWTVLGELSKWVPMSPQRFVSVSSTDSSLEVHIKGAVGESVDVWFAGPADKMVKVNCQLLDSGSAVVRMPAAECGSVGL